MSDLARRAFFGFAAAAPFAAAGAVTAALKPQAFDSGSFKPAFDAAMQEYEAARYARLINAISAAPLSSFRWAPLEAGFESVSDNELSAAAGVGLDLGVVDPSELTALDNVEALPNCEFPDLGRIALGDCDEGVEQNPDHGLTSDAVAQVGRGESVFFREHNSVSVGSVGATNVTQGEIKMIDLPNPFESAPEAGRPAGAALSPSPAGAAPVGTSSPEVMATSAPGMARDVIEIPAFLKRIDSPKSETSEA